MDGMTSRARTVNGVPTSLLDLGYSDVGLDDAWQVCGSNGDKQYTYHDENGNPIVDTNVFPDFKKMTDYAHDLGLTAGWYGNNCICEDHCVSDACYENDVKALIDYGFDSVKLDGCGKELNLQKWSDLINATGKSVLIENCHWGLTLPKDDWCPWNYYRTSGDVRASYESVLFNLMTVPPLATKNLSTPGCWAYPDMLEVGCANGPGGENDPGLTFNEARTHFGAWAIVSSPLILSHDTTNDTVTDEIWPIISNTEAIAINQAWAGESGNLFKSSTDIIVLKNPYIPTHPTLGSADTVQGYVSTEVGSWQQWSKRITECGSSVAVLVMNNDEVSQTIAVTFADVPSLASSTSGQYSIRDVWGHADLGNFESSWEVTLDSHDSAFVVIAVPPPPPAVAASASTTGTGAGTAV